MSLHIAHRAAAIAPSQTLAIDAAAKKMVADGMDVVGFGAGEPDFDTPPHVVAAAHEALDKRMFRYTPVPGTVDLRKAICEKLKRDNGLTYAVDEIVVSNGAKHSLFNVFQAIVDPGDEVLLPAPYWVSYPEMICMAGGVPVIVETYEKDGFQLDINALKAKISSKTRALVLNSPSNPTGVVYNRAIIEAIAKLAVEHDFYVVSDEIYEQLVYEGEAVSVATFGDAIKERTIMVNGLSKSAAMTGWRIGYTASNKALASVMSNYQSHAASNPNSIAQYASIAAMQPSPFVGEMAKAFKERRDYMVQRINSIPGLSALKPEGAFYVMMNVSGVYGKSCNGTQITDSLTFSSALLKDGLTAVVPGIAFGIDTHVRLSYATSMENIVKGLDRIEAFVKSLT